MSSPHARGSSVARRSAGQRYDVVPARAGIFLHLAWPGRQPAVVPARAGIFPPCAPRCSPRTSRPRTRGDLPPSASPSRPPGESSPHARGSSTHLTVHEGIRQVVPARAGIFRGDRSGVAAGAGRPRTRGDLPGSACQVTPFTRSSPHARGSSVADALGVPLGDVVPARAGIFPSPSLTRRRSGSRPRTRGDLPGSLPTSRRGTRSSPHARGSSARRRRCIGPGGVVPARAGIFRCGPHRGRRRGGRPRTRGDLPPTIDGSERARTSSPHARGSSFAGTVPRDQAEVVPARAGIFRRASPCRRSCCGRPRTRGDLP